MPDDRPADRPADPEVIGTDAPAVRVETDGAVCRLVLARPDRLNAFTGETHLGLRLGLEGALADPAIGAVVLASEGRAFSAGADRSLLDGTATPDQRALAGREFFAVLDLLASYDLPVLAAVQGPAVGVGVTILGSVDLIVVGESARLRLPFTTLGITTEAGSSHTLTARSRWSDIAWAFYSGDWIDADTAVAMGLAWRSAPDATLLDDVMAAARVIAANPREALMATKRLLTAGRADAVRDAIARETTELRTLFRKLRGVDDGD